jgi:hypothetical protein
MSVPDVSSIHCRCDDHLDNADGLRYSSSSTTTIEEQSISVSQNHNDDDATNMSQSNVPLMFQQQPSRAVVVTPLNPCKQLVSYAPSHVPLYHPLLHSPTLPLPQSPLQFHNNYWNHCLAAQQQQQHQHQYIVVTLQKSNPLIPWGISVSYLHGAVVIGHVVNTKLPTSRSPPESTNATDTTGGVTTAITNTSADCGATKAATTYAHVEEYWITESTIVPTCFFHNSITSSAVLHQHPSVVPLANRSYTTTMPWLYHRNNALWFRNHLWQQRSSHSHVMFRASPTTPTTTVVPSMVLQPGDCIVQIMDPNATQQSPVPLQYQQWDSLPSFLHALRQCTTTVQLILYRHPNANIAAAAAAAAAAAETTNASFTGKTNVIASSSSLSNINNHRDSAPMRTQYAAALAAWKVLAIEFPILATIQQRVTPRKLFGPQIPNNSNALSLKRPSVSSSSATAPKKVRRVVDVPKNPLFTHPTTGEMGIVFVDDVTLWSTLYDPDECLLDNVHPRELLPPIQNFTKWICQRKEQWRKRYKVYAISIPADTYGTLDNTMTFSKRTKDLSKRHLGKRSCSDWDDRTVDCNVHIDFWTHQGYVNHLHWLHVRTAQWKTNYSWNKQKRQVLEKDLYCHPNSVLLPLCKDSCNNSTIPIAIWEPWLRVRKNQWKVLRRKRQRRLAAASGVTTTTGTFVGMTETSATATTSDATIGTTAGSTNDPSSIAVSSIQQDTTTVVVVPNLIPTASSEFMVIDALLEEQEQRERSLTKEKRLPYDLSFVFDSAMGCPDDVVSKIFQYLHPIEHGKLLCINHVTRNQLKHRDEMWKQLLPSHWKIPRRPRKPWYELYITNLRVETERSRKLWDDLLSKVATILLHGDQLQAVEKLVHEAQRGHHQSGFDINYASGVVCERNSILNLAVIHRRHSTYSVLLFWLFLLIVSHRYMISMAQPTNDVLLLFLHVSLWHNFRGSPMVGRSQKCRYRIYGQRELYLIDKCCLGWR